jgi:uncharacterized protein (DUF1697 family)
MQSPYIALLRGINLASRNRLPMKTLEKMFSDAGCDGVRSYIQSGNVFFRANKTLAGKLSNHIAAQILESFGFRVPVILRTAEQIAETVKGNPFANNEAMTDMLHVIFLPTNLAKNELLLSTMTVSFRTNSLYVELRSIFVFQPALHARN